MKWLWHWLTTSKCWGCGLRTRHYYCWACRDKSRQAYEFEVKATRIAKYEQDLEEQYQAFKNWKANKDREISYRVSADPDLEEFAYRAQRAWELKRRQQ